MDPCASCCEQFGSLEIVDEVPLCLGYHAQKLGSVIGTINGVKSRGCSCAQVFLTNPRSYMHPKPLTQDEYHKVKTELNSGFKLFVHASLYSNLAGEATVREKTFDTLQASLSSIYDLDMPHVLHTGSATVPGMDRTTALRRVAESANSLQFRGFRKLLFENCAGEGNKLTKTWDEYHLLFEALDHSHRFGECWDTAHGFASGLSAQQTHEQITELFDCSKEYGPGISLVHLNDSKVCFCGCSDRHENICQGHIWGREENRVGLNSLLERCRDDSLAVVLETPSEMSDYATIKSMWSHLF